MRWRISDSLAGLVGRVQAQEVWKTDEVIFNRPGWTQSSAGNLTLHAYTKTHTRSVHLHAHQPLTHLITSARPERRQGGGRGSSGTQWPHCSCSRTHISRLNTHVFGLLGQAESIWDVKRELQRVPDRGALIHCTTTLFKYLSSNAELKKYSYYRLRNTPELFSQ